MSIKIRRYQANESQFEYGVRDKTSINIPGSVGFTDLTKSSLVFDMHVDVKKGDETVLYPATFGRRGQVVGAQALVRNARVTSKAHGLLNERRHQNVIDANLDWYLSSRAKEDQRSLEGHINNKNYGADYGSRLPDNPWLAFEFPSVPNTGAGTPGVAVTTPASTRRADIHIPWKHIDQFAVMSEFPNVAVGDLNYEVELENQIPAMYPAEMAVQAEGIENVPALGGLIGIPGAVLVTRKPVAQWNRPPMIGDIVTLYYHEETSAASRTDINRAIKSVDLVTAGGVSYYGITLVRGAPVTLATENCTNITFFRGQKPSYYVNDCTPDTLQCGTAAAPLILPNIFPDGASSYHLCPLYVGAPIFVIGTQETAAPPDTKVFGGDPTAGATPASQGYFTVASLRITNFTDLEVVLDEPIEVDTAAALTDIRLAYRDHDAAYDLFTVTWVIDEMYANMHEIQMRPDALNAIMNQLRNGVELNFLEQRLMQQTVNGSNIITQGYELQPNCYALATLTPQTNELLSGFDTCTSYRYSLDGKEQSTRDIPCGSDPTANRQIHNHMLSKYFENLKLALAKYDANYYDYGSPDDQRNHAIFPLVVPFLPRQQTVQIQLFSDSTMAGKNLFFVETYGRVLKISGGSVTVS